MHTDTPFSCRTPSAHWFLLLPCLLQVVAALALVVALQLFNLLGLVLIACTVPFTANRVVTYFTTAVAVDHTGVRIAAGVNKVSVEIPITHIDSVQVERTALGRLVGYGRVTVISLGGNVVSTPWIENPEGFAEWVKREMSLSV